MARMYPREIGPETESAAEHLLFGQLRHQLSDDYLVFHSVAWQTLTPGGRRRDGEADFVVLHPKNGILVVEVKGGEIIHDRKQGRWYSVDRSGKPHQIKDPIKQALASKYCLLDLLAEVAHQPSRRINIGHAAAFPDVFVTDRILSPDLPPAILLGQNHLTDVAGWMRAVLDHYRGKEDRGLTAPGPEVLEKLLELIGKSISLKPAMWGQILLEKQQQAELTRQQYLLLDALSRRSRALVSGCAGSGKTMLAAEKASRLATSGFETLLTCFNKNLAAFLRSRLGTPPRLTVQHFHELGYELAVRAGVLDGTPAFDNEFFSEVLPDAMLRAIEAEGDFRFDAIVVDEAQDFEDAWWIPLQSLLRDPDEGIFYIFFDEAQCLYNQELEFPIVDEPYVLDVNCRNTRLIQDQIRRFSDTPMRPHRRAVEGRPVELLRYESAEGPVPAIEQVLERLTVDEHIPSPKVVLLSPLSRHNPHTALGPNERIGGYVLTDSPDPADGEIRCSTVHGFKGCESDVVILLEVERWPEERDPGSLMYVATSRARHHLVVALSDDAPEELVRQFA